MATRNLLALLFLPMYVALDNGVALLPPMGTYECFIIVFAQVLIYEIMRGFGHEITQLVPFLRVQFTENDTSAQRRHRH